MKKQIRIPAVILSVICLTLLILFPKIALCGMQSGIEVCLKSVIPALFPFVFVSGILISSANQNRLICTGTLSRLLGIPAGSESIYLLGCIGGYPIGAQTIYTQYKKGALSYTEAQHMIRFCNNAGPSFIFGIVSGFFSNPSTPWIIWSIQIISSALVGIITNKNHSSVFYPKPTTPITLPEILKKSLYSIGSICGWVVLFQTALSYLEATNLLKESLCIYTFVSGFLELTNGCLMLNNIPSESLRFIVASILLSSGGCCVAMQTSSVTKSLWTSNYIGGKLLQCILSAILATAFSCLIFENRIIAGSLIFLFLLIVVLTIIFLKKQKIDIEKKIKYEYNRAKL